MTYRAPVNDIMAALQAAADIDGLIGEGLFGTLDRETIRAIIEEAARFGEEVLAPLDREGDRVGSHLVEGKVETPPGWADAYRRFAEAGWCALPAPEEHGGQNLPETVAMAVAEIWGSSNLGFSLCPVLTQGAIEALHIAGSAEVKRLYLPRMVSGEWTGTMNLTEPQAGSDLGFITTKAVPHHDGSYRITGTKIFISYGDHEMTDNIIHLVLARLPDAPPGTRGISLFVVPKRLVGPDGSLGERNDVVCAGVEHKLGIHASPTAVMKFGEEGGAVGYLVGEENRGLNTMFIMMNAARLGVGVQGVAVAERARQRAATYAAERRQGRTMSSKPGEMGPIVEHADVRRMLLTMKAQVHAARSICLATAREIDISRRAINESARRDAADRAALLTPIAKAFSTDTGCEVSSLGIQVHGGMGYVEETGAAQHFRDARILPIYEGTNGIQAIDLVTRKLPLQGGRIVMEFIREMRAVAGEIEAANRLELGRTGQRLRETLDALATATDWMGMSLQKDPEAALASATPYLRLFALAAGGHFLGKAALADMRDGGDGERIALLRFFAENSSVAGPGLAECVMGGAHAVLAVEPSRLAS